MVRRHRTGFRFRYLSAECMSTGWKIETESPQREINRGNAKCYFFGYRYCFLHPDIRNLFVALFFFFFYLHLFSFPNFFLRRRISLSRSTSNVGITRQDAVRIVSYFRSYRKKINSIDRNSFRLRTIYVWKRLTVKLYRQNSLRNRQ